MPDVSGLELKHSLQNPPTFIFISSYPEYAVESYNLDVIDFISKPVSFARLLKATNKAIEYIELKKKAAFHIDASALADTHDSVYVRDDNGLSQLKIADIILIESMGNFSKIYTAHKRHMTLVSLKNIEDQLPNSSFIRVHKQYIINLKHIESLATSGELTMTNQEMVPVGKIYKTTLANAIQGKILMR
jgi:two-component system, LytTR family, response regulator